MAHSDDSQPEITQGTDSDGFYALVRFPDGGYFNISTCDSSEYEDCGCMGVCSCDSPPLTGNHMLIYHGRLGIGRFCGRSATVIGSKENAISSAKTLLARVLAGKPIE